MSRTAKSPSRESAVRVFVSHSHKDSYWMDALMPLLPPGAQSWAEVLREFQQCDMALTPIRDSIKAVVERARARKCATVAA